MRKLIIKRTKSFVGCLGKMKIYIEDIYGSDIVINNVPCRKLGDLKNNEEKTFEIGEDPAKVFVIADKLSKNYCNEFYQLPFGQEDVFLSGQNKFNPANGNAFRFDNNENAEALQNRKKGSKKGLAILCVVAILGSVMGYFVGSDVLSGTKTEPKAFSDNGMNITLTNEFIYTPTDNYTNCYDSNKVAVFALKEEFSLLDGSENFTLEQYGDLVLQNNGFSSLEIKNIDGLIGFEYEYTNPDTNDTYKYVSFVYKSNDAFWLVQFATLTENSDEYYSKITEWAKSVYFE